LQTFRIGVLSLQGDFREHIRSVESTGHTAFALNRVEEIASIDGLILPGGESTTIAKLAKSFDLFSPIQSAIASGLPVYGSCAGMILLAHEIEGAAVGQESFGGIDMKVRRNAFGRQVDSFESDIDFNGISAPAVRGVFIRAPWVESIAEGVQTLASVETESGPHPVAVRQASALATSFHPELTEDSRVHRYFIEEIVAKARR
jgi:pyridoxal 5'-phosphate synthase pdxT subunit